MFEWISRLFTSESTSHVSGRTQIGAASANDIRAPVSESAPIIPVTVSVEPVPDTASAIFIGPLHEIDWLSREAINACFLSELFRRSEPAELFITKHERKVLELLDDAIQSGQAGVKLVRRMPGIIPQLLQSLRHDNFSGTQLAKMISNDVVLVAAVIRIVNSSAHNQGQRITSIEHAILVLGQTGLRQLITTVAFQPIMDLNSGPYTKAVALALWHHSEQCALACKSIASQFEQEPFDSFLTGLLQNVGLIVALHVVDSMQESQYTLGSTTFLSRLSTLSRRLSCSIAQEWNFPESIAQAIAEQENVKLERCSTLGQILCLGDYLAKLSALKRLAPMMPEVQECYANLSPELLEICESLDEFK